MATLTWTLADTLSLNDALQEVTVAGRYVYAYPAPPLPDGHYLISDGVVLRPALPLMSALVAANGSFSIAGLPCAVGTEQDPADTPWRVVMAGPDGRVQLWQGVPPGSAGNGQSYTLAQLVTGGGGAEGWGVVS